METDREQLRTIYNRDFKTRYGPAHSPAQKRGPSSPPRPPRPGHPSRPGSGGTQLPQWLWRVPGRRRPPSRAVPTPRPRRPGPARFAPAGPLRRVPAESLPRSRSLGALGLGRGPAATRRSRGAEGTALGVGEGSVGWGPEASRERGKELPAGGGESRRGVLGYPRPLVEGLLLRGSTIPEETQCRRETLREHEKGTNCVCTKPPLAPVASPWRPRARANPLGPPSTLWWKAV